MLQPSNPWSWLLGGMMATTLGLIQGSLLPVEAAPAASKGKAVVPAASYSMEALTQTGLDNRSMGGGNMLQMMMGGQPGISFSTTRSLTLELNAPKVVVNAPKAEHRIPTTMGMGSSLPLSSASTTDQRDRESAKDSEEKLPAVRILFFRGCAEKAGADQPEIIASQQLTLEQRRMTKVAMQEIHRKLERSDQSGTSGIWPVDDNAPSVPTQSSMIGDHQVESNYAPQIRFQVDAAHDFMGPLMLRSEAAGEARRLTWQQVPTALGYQALASGVGRKEGEIVMWSSSDVPFRESAVPAALKTAEASRLIGRRVLLSPERTSCTISAQAMAAMQTGMVSVTAYGDTLTLNGPQGAQPWSVNLVRRSIANRPLGQGLEMLEGGATNSGEGKGAGGQQEPPKKPGFNPFSLF